MPHEGLILVRPGDEFAAADLRDLLPRLRIDPSLGVVDAMQTSLTIYVDDDEVDLDVDSVFGTDPEQRLFAADDDDAFGFVLELCGDWLHEWAADSVDAYTFWDRSVPLQTVAESLINNSELAEDIWSERSTQTWYPIDRGDA